MKLTVKTLKGSKFEIEVEESNTVAEVKGIIEKTKAEMPASSCKLIHSGKVLKDADTLTSCGVKANDFLVIMVTKPKTAKPAAAAAAPAAAAATTESTKPASSSTTPAAKTPAAATSTTSAATTTPAPSTSSSTTTAPDAPGRSDAATATDNIPAEAIANLTSMGFPEAEVRHCLRAAHGNPDVAVEFLTNGIPDAVAQAMLASGGGSASPVAPSSSGGSGSGSQPLQALRNHPQFGALRRLVQSNPAMLQQVLTQIGQQDPQLLAEINQNQALFLEMMNEPVNESQAVPPLAPPQGAPRGSGGGGIMEGMGNPAQMAQMIQNMSPQEVQQMAAMMGLSPEQLRASAQMIGQMPPEQLQQFMMQAMGGGPGMMGGGGGGGDFGGPQVLHLTAEEMAAVDRLTEMGFDRSEAAQAFLACDKNEALAANLLMDSSDGGGGGGFFGGGGGGSGNNNDNNGGGNNNNNNDDEGGDQDEDMYD